MTHSKEDVLPHIGEFVKVTSNGTKYIGVANRLLNESELEMIVCENKRQTWSAVPKLLPLDKIDSIEWL